MIEQTNEAESLGLVWLYCPYPIIARGLSEILREKAQVHHGKQPPKVPPSCVLLCVDGGEDLSHTVKRLRATVPDTPILVCGPSNHLASARTALQAGARGFVHVGMLPSQIVRALLVASRGEVAVPRELLKDLVAEESPVDLSDLTSRQLEILELVVEGQTNAQIGQKLFLSESTIKQHLRAAYKVLKVRNRTEAAKLLREKI